MSVKEHHVEESLEADFRYSGLEKFWSFFVKEELVKLLNDAGFSIVNVEIAHKNDAYHTHPLIKIFAKK